MSQIAELAERVERLLLRHEETRRENQLLQAQLSAITLERDSLRSRLAAARQRIDALIDRLPVEAATSPGAPPHAMADTPTSTHVTGDDEARAPAGER